MSSTKTTRIFLALNGTFSFIMGIDLVFAARPIAEMLFAQNGDWQLVLLRVLGVGLLIFAIDLFLMSTNRLITKGQVLLISGMDAGWVLGSALLLMVDGHHFTGVGAVLVALTAVIVAIFAIGQYVGAGKIVPPKSRVSVTSIGGKLHATVSRSVRAPAGIVWRVMTDHPRYADVASNISKVEVLSGEGLGLERRCYGPKGENWSETCDVFEDGKAFGFKVHTKALDYPYPISELQGRWAVQPKGSGAEFEIEIEARPKGGFLMQKMFKLAATRKFKAVLTDLAEAWADRMEREQTAN